MPLGAQIEIFLKLLSEIAVPKFQNALLLVKNGPDHLGGFNSPQRKGRDAPKLLHSLRQCMMN